MLHEVLLALSGHPSPLFGDQGTATASDLPLLSPSETALLQSIGRLSKLHRALKRHLESICASHQSIICRAVATSMLHTHLALFQQRILDVEAKILEHNALMVGAYDIVPLAAIVGEFDDWHRLMEWYWQIACFVSPSANARQIASGGHNSHSSGAQLVDRLRSETQTGYPEIEAAATELAKVAETAWLRQVASWVVYGKLPSFGAEDFFIQPDGVEDQIFKKDKRLLPGFVSSASAASILFIGKSLHQVQHYRRETKAAATSERLADDDGLAAKHLELLSSLSLPIIPSQLSRTISAVRLSLSQNVLQHLLPMETILQVLSCLRQFVFMERGEFAVALIAEAEKRIQARQQSMGRLLRQDPAKALHGLTIRDAELNQSLQQVWKALVAGDGEEDNEILEYAREHISLSAPKAPSSRPPTSESISSSGPNMTAVAFNDMLFPSQCELRLNAPSPLDLFLSTQDAETYTAISSYLLAIRRGHQRLGELWRRTPARRDHPVSALRDADARQRNKQRSISTRKVWATCSATIFLLSETSAFFEGEIITGSYDHFLDWVKRPARSENLERSMGPKDDAKTAQRDPETLAFGHRTFLSSLLYALILTDTAYTCDLRSLLGNVDNLIAFFNHLLDVQLKLDLEHQAGEESAHTLDDEKRIALELDRARKKVDSDLKSVVYRLRQLDQERIGSLRYLDFRPSDKSDYEVWKGGGLDRLLMKLDFGGVDDGSYRHPG